MVVQLTKKKELLITIVCGDKSVILTYTDELVHDLKGIMALDLHEELLNIIVAEFAHSVTTVLTDNENSILGC